MPGNLDLLNSRFPRKRAFITGAGSGLGLAMAQQLAEQRWSLGLFDMNTESLAAAEGMLSGAGVTVQAYPGDVTQADELTVAINSYSQSAGGLDVMINNAGVPCAGNIMEVTSEQWRWIIDINVMGMVHGCRAAIPHLQLNGRSLLLNIASAAAFVSMPDAGPYNVTKAAAVSLSETLVMELREKNIQVSVAMPGFFRTELLKNYRGSAEALATGRDMMSKSGISADDMARDILIAAAAGKTYIVLPRQYLLLWRFKRWLPEFFLKKLPSLRDRA
jgi:NADP-dependent 3-hydroxy acid dehydrogenase YdfG